MPLARRPYLFSLFLLAGLAISNLATAQPYELTFERPFAVGSQYAISGEAYVTEEMHQRVNGQLAEESESHAELNLTGSVEVLAVNDHGGVTRLALTIAEYDIEIDDRGIELAAGQRILAAVGDDGVTISYENGQAVDEAIFELLDTFLGDLIDDDEVGENDAMMNMAGPKSPGDRWQFNHDKMIQDAAEDGELDLAAAAMESEMHFVEVNQDNEFGEPVAVLETTATMKDFGFPEGTFPGWLEIKGAEIKLGGGGMLPLDKASHQGTHTMEFELAFLAAGKVPGEEVQVEIEVEAQRGMTITLKNLP